MTIHQNSIIGQLVAQDYRAASVFKKYGIDFCCQGNRTIQDACTAKQLDENSVLEELNALQHQQTNGHPDFQTWPLDLLADYIEKKHHRYVAEKSQEIIPYLDKICRVHGARHPELFEIKAHFYDAANELAMHMEKEEMVLFPFVRQMSNRYNPQSSTQSKPMGSVKNPIAQMMHEHNTEGERFRKIEALSNNYTPPSDACSTYAVTFALLKEFEQDLHLHIHLENNILFPKAIELEKNLS